MAKKKKPMPKFLIILLAVLAVYILLRVAITLLSANRIATGLVVPESGPAYLSGCNGLRNCTASTASTERNRVEPLSYNGGGDDVIERIAAVIKQQSGAKIETQSPVSLRATYKTPLLGFIDDLEILVDDENRVAHIRSASRIGQSDLGANRKRIEALRQELQGNI